MTEYDPDPTGGSVVDRILKAMEQRSDASTRHAFQFPDEEISEETGLDVDKVKQGMEYLCTNRVIGRYLDHRYGTFYHYCNGADAPRSPEEGGQS